MTVKGIDISLGEKKRGPWFDPVIAFLAVIILCAAGLFWLYGLQLAKEIVAKKSEVAEVTGQINELKDKVPQINQLKTDIENIKRDTDSIRVLKNDPLKYSNLLVEVSLLTPQNIWFTSINIAPDTRTVSFSGIAALYKDLKPLEAIAQFMRALSSKSRYFIDANLASASSGTVGATPTYTFQIDSHYDSAKAAEVQVTTPQTPGFAPPPPGTAPGESPSPGAASPGASPGTGTVPPGASAAPGAGMPSSGAPPPAGAEPVPGAPAAPGVGGSR